MEFFDAIMLYPQGRKSQLTGRAEGRIGHSDINIADVRKDHMHRISNDLSKNRAVIELYDLWVQGNMTALAKGIRSSPEKRQVKVGLNRAKPDQGWVDRKLY